MDIKLAKSIQRKCLILLSTVKMTYAGHNDVPLPYQTSLIDSQYYFIHATHAHFYG